MVVPNPLGFLRTLQPFFPNACVFPPLRLGARRSSQEFCSFPKGKYTDQVDATTQLLDHASEFDGLAFASGERAIAATASGRYVALAPVHGGGRAIAGVARYGRPAGSASLNGPIFSIKTEVKY